VSLVPSAFRPRFPWWGGDLQTLANRLRGIHIDLAPHRSDRVCFLMADGDTLLAMLDRPHVPGSGRPLAILIHGLTGTEDSIYILSQARLLLERGFNVLRLNLRGAGPSRALCCGQYYAGRSQDLRELLTLLPAALTGNGIVAVGYSLGGAMLLKYLGEEGHSTPVKRAATVCAPIELSATCRNMMRARNAIYHRHILSEMKRDALGEGAAVSAEERARILAARTLWDYDEDFIAPRHGFAGAEDYYERCKPVRFMADIRVPTLTLAALDDPWIPGATYASHDWAANKALHPLLPRSGGHVGFHGADDGQPWSDRVVADFLG
jgi:predicted alpha/beta-fold hydrolase